MEMELQQKTSDQSQRITRRVSERLDAQTRLLCLWRWKTLLNMKLRSDLPTTTQEDHLGLGRDNGRQNAVMGTPCPGQSMQRTNLEIQIYLPKTTTDCTTTKLDLNTVNIENGTQQEGVEQEPYSSSCSSSPSASLMRYTICNYDASSLKEDVINSLQPGEPLLFDRYVPAFYSTQSSERKLTSSILFSFLFFRNTKRKRQTKTTDNSDPEVVASSVVRRKRPRTTYYRVGNPDYYASQFPDESKANPPINFSI